MKIGLAGLLAVSTLGAVNAAVAQIAAADTTLTNGKIIAVDDRFGIAEAVAIRGERFVAVGTDTAIAALANDRTHRTRRDGRMTAAPTVISS